MKRWALRAAFAVALASGVAAAAEIEGVAIPAEVRLEGVNTPLVLNGAGVRHKLAFLKVYVGALYLTAQRKSAQDVLADPGAKRVAMHILSDEVTAKAFTASLNDALAANHIPAELALIESRIQTLNRMMSSLGAIRKGSVVLVDYLPGVGTRITVNGEEKITIPGEDFFRALLRVWVGAKPVDGRLRDAMLGGSGIFRLF